MVNECDISIHNIFSIFLQIFVNALIMRNNDLLKVHFSDYCINSSQMMDKL